MLSGVVSRIIRQLWSTGMSLRLNCCSRQSCGPNKERSRRQSSRLSMSLASMVLDPQHPEFALLEFGAANQNGEGIRKIHLFNGTLTLLEKWRGIFKQSESASTLPFFAWRGRPKRHNSSTAGQEECAWYGPISALGAGHGLVVIGTCLASVAFVLPTV